MSDFYEDLELLEHVQQNWHNMVAYLQGDPRLEGFLARWPEEIFGGEQA